MTNNEKGFMAIGISLVLTAVVLGILLMQYAKNTAIERGLMHASMAAQEKTNLVAAISMIEHEKTSCAANIPGAFGATLAELSSKSASNTLKIFYPVGNRVLLEPNAEVGASRIVSLAFDVAPAPFLGQAFAATLNVTFRLKSTVETMGAPLYSVKVPFYFVADATGKLLSCASTLPWSGDGRGCTTLEDYACQTQFGAAATSSGTASVPSKVFKYNPDTGNCVETAGDANGVSPIRSTTTCDAG